MYDSCASNSHGSNLIRRIHPAFWPHRDPGHLYKLPVSRAGFAFA